MRYFQLLLSKSLIGMDSIIFFLKYIWYFYFFDSKKVAKNCWGRQSVAAAIYISIDFFGLGCRPHTPYS